MEMIRYYPDPAIGIDIARVNRAVEDAFAEHGRGNVQMPPKVYVNLPAGDFRTMPAYVPSLQMTGVKIVNVHPENPKLGLPTVMATTLILDIATGIPTAILNATGLTDLRTGSAGAIAAKHLSPKREIVLGVVGSGRQAETQIRATSCELKIREIKIWSRELDHAEKLAGKFSAFSARTTGLEETCDCDVLVTTTPSRKPVISNEWIHPGIHINAIGADAPGKEELDPSILLRARVFVDDPAQALHSGEVNIPVQQGIFTEKMIVGTLGDVVTGKYRRESPDEITVFDSTGLAIQDLAIAKIAMQTGNFIEIPFEGKRL